MVAIKYVGKKQSQRDSVAGTGLTWVPGQTHYVDDAAAVMLLRHEDAWMIDMDAPAPIDIMSVAKAKIAQEAEVEEPPPLIAVSGMTRQELVNFAMREFGQRTPSKMPIEELRTRVVSLMNSGRQAR